MLVTCFMYEKKIFVSISELADSLHVVAMYVHIKESYQALNSV